VDVKTSGESLYHHRFEIRTSGESSNNYHCQILIRTVGDGHFKLRTGGDKRLVKSSPLFQIENLAIRMKNL
jgi:hypothetical protein